MAACPNRTTLAPPKGYSITEFGENIKITPELITELLEQCEEERNPWIERAEKGWRLMYVQEPAEGEIGSGTLKYSTKENRIHAKLLDWRSILLKNKPTFRVQATKPQDIDLSDSVTAVSYKRWKDNNAHFALSNSQLEVGYAGIAFLRLNLIEVKQDVYVEEVINVPRIDFWHDTRVLDIGKSWCCYRTWNSVENLRKYFGKRGIDIVAESAEGTPAVEYEEPRPFSPAFTTSATTDQKPPKSWGDELIPLLEFWAPPPMTGENDWNILYMIQDTNKILYESENIWRSVVREAVPERRELNPTTGENVVAPAEPEISVGHGQPPFVVHRCYFKPTEKGYLGFYDVEGIAEHLETVQYDLTETRRALMLMARRAAEPPSIEEETSLVNDTLSLEPRARNVYRQTKQPPVFIDEGLQSAIPANAYAINKEVMNELSGIREFMTGEQPQGTSGTPTGTIMFAQEAAYIRMPDIVQQLDKAILSLAKLMLGNMQQFIKEGEFVDVAIGGQPHWVEWSQAHIETDFNIEVVSGMTTILKDISRQQSSSNIFTQVGVAVQSQSIGMLKACKQWILSLDEPTAYGYLPVIDEEIDMLEQATQTQAQMAGQGLMPPEMMTTQEGV